MKKVLVYIISDSVGESAQKIVSAVEAQFYQELELEVRRFAFVTHEDDLKFVLRGALKSKAIVVATLVNQELLSCAHAFAKRTGLGFVDLMSPLTQLITSQTGIVSKEEPGAIYTLPERQLSSVTAIEFAEKYDDGKDPNGFEKADILILGVSRSAKTPLSMYLAVKSYKVANLPLIPEVALPEQLFNVPKEKIFGLVGNPESILEVRKARLDYLGLNEDSSYANLERIEQELRYAHEVFEKVGAQLISTDKRSIEEVAAEIEEKLGRRS
ncbi:pyruvate, water dikinase regulatory protein [Vagococcus xieshaowenii]|uniref:Putative pyruvate, phosphate dikinase regulatory protein n=1 Tax=Vagococcus xieshaowenii TaxID=2562451 RepID=A0AAJ5JR05_9ENTE|nr:pyruvate, water dikinase regulatory protein [Vagococcus xieshaowenii]QCA29230.1 kinase/pyrophosphorylase [Vagococcus xieshaowenii]TFZ43257.1 kinase/pyrophosphorylase [Vagococcus xieshaowenii]